MNYRQLGKYGVKVSEVALGSWLTYGNVTGRDTAEACIDRAYEIGINFFDTADGYANGEAERVVGKTLAKFERSSYFLATKVFFPMGPGPNDRGLSRKHIVEGCHASLKRLGMDYIDLYQCHRYDNGTPLEETVTALNDLARQGKILYYGVSEWTSKQITDANDIARKSGLLPLVSNQPEYSMLRRGIENDVIPACEREGIGQVVWSPLAQGLLTGKYKPGQPLPEGSRATDKRQNYFLADGNLDQDLLTAIHGLEPIARDCGLSMAQLALAWCLRKQNVACVIIGASKVSQVDDNAGATGVTLSAEVLAAIDQTLGKHVSHVEGHLHFRND